MEHATPIVPKLDRSNPDQIVIGVRQDLILIPLSSFIIGFVSGLLTQSRLAGRQFLAENAHRLPTTVQGWYFYTKTKNYRVMYGGITGGLKTGARLGAWTVVFVGLQEGIEYSIKRVAPSALENVSTRWAAGGIAGVSLAAASSRLYRLSKQGGMRRLFLASSLGIVAGGSHDLRDWMRVKLERDGTHGGD